MRTRSPFFRPSIILVAMITLALVLGGCNDRPVSPLGSVENSRQQSLQPRQRKTLDRSHMRLLKVKAPVSLHKGHVCSGDKTQMVKAGKGDKLNLCHETLEIPGDALAQDTNISFAAVDENLAMVEIRSNISFKTPATLTLSLKVVNLVDVDINALTISRYNEATNEWNSISSTLDGKQESLSAAITQAGRYALTWINRNAGYGSAIGGSDGSVENDFITWQGEQWGGRREKSVSREKGGRLAFHGHEMEIPPFALSANQTMSITEVHRGNAQVDFGPSGWFNKPVTVTISFKAIDLTGVDLNNLTVTWYDPATGEWIDVGGTVDVKGQKIYVQVWHFTQYSLAVR